MLSLWGLQHLDLSVFLWDLKSIVLKPKQNVSCMLLSSEFISLFILLISISTYPASVLCASGHRSDRSFTWWRIDISD